jgi:kinesin family protein 15
VGLRLAARVSYSLGYNCTILAYGQTGAGKTYTMLGRGIDSPDILEAKKRGIQPRVLEYLFEQLCEIKDQDKDVEYLIKASYFEIYNENIIDLVSSN